MKLAYADPPYYGRAGRIYAKHHGEAARDYDKLETHAALIARLVDEFPDGWALSMGANNLQDILPLCPPGVRVAAWVKPFASWKRGQNPAWCWEPVVFVRTRKHRIGIDLTARDYISQNIVLKKGLTGAKPEPVCSWILDLLGFEAGDEVMDVFPGTGIMDKVIRDRGGKPLISKEE